MKNSNEIKALLHLLDDPDTEIYETVSKKIMHFGKEIIPNLEEFWENTTNNEVQERIEFIIHKVNFEAVYHDFEKWFNANSPSLLVGSMHIAKFRFPDFSEQIIHKTIKSIYQSCWLELNNFLTPLEQIHIINSIFYSMYKFKGFDLDDNKPNHFFINEVIDSRHGNNYSLGIIYQILCEMLDIPVFMVHLPQHCLLAYFETVHDFFNIEKKPEKKIQFYIDPGNGTIYTQNDVNAYIKKYDFEIEEDTFQPLNNKDIICGTIESLSNVYEELKEIEKHEELSQLIELRNKFL